MARLNNTQLAERPLLGFPGITAELRVEKDGTYKINVGDTTWTTDDRREASDRYFHPFCYGYDYVPIPDMEVTE